MAGKFGLDFTCQPEEQDTVAIVLGSPGVHSHFHALQDFGFLGRMLQFFQAGAFDGLGKKVKVVFTKWYWATWSAVDQRMLFHFDAAKRRRGDYGVENWLLPMNVLYYKAALNFFPGYDLEIEVTDDASVHCKRCYGATVQPWRDFPSDGIFWNQFRRNILELCSIDGAEAKPWKKKIVIATRTRFVRGMGNLERMLTALQRELPEVEGLNFD